MIQIDRLTRFTIGNMKVLFRDAQEAKRKIEALPENKQSRFTPQLLEQILVRTISLEGVKYTIVAETNTEYQIIAFRFMCCHNGKNITQRVSIQYKPSNLGLKPVPYFVCPYTERCCRNIYTDGKIFISRWGFNHTYRQRNLSKQWRKVDKLLVSLKDPERKYGKTHYRGKLTPYGKKLFQYYETISKVSDVERILIPKPKGRPRTGVTIETKIIWDDSLLL